MTLSRSDLAVKIVQISAEVDLVDRPRVLDGIAIHIEELRVTHGAQRQIEARIQDVVGPSRLLGSRCIENRLSFGGGAKADRVGQGCAIECRISKCH